MKKRILRIIYASGCFLFLLAGCVHESVYTQQKPKRNIRNSTTYQLADRLIRMESDTLLINLDPVTLETTIFRKDRLNERVSISQAVFHRKTFQVFLADRSILYPEDNLKVSFDLENKGLKVTFQALKPQTITWPSLMMKKEDAALIWPHFEGNYIPLHDTIWAEYLTSRTWNTTEGLYMPFWGVEQGRQMLSYLVENPFHNEIAFKEKQNGFLMELTHTFPNNADLSKGITFRIHLDDDVSQIAPAKHFRHYLKEQNAFVTFEEKMKIAPPIAQLIGAPHAYIWDGAPITMTDVKTEGWIPLATDIVEQATSQHPTAGKQIMSVLSPERGHFEAMSRQSTPVLYLKRAMAQNLSTVLRSPELYHDAVWPLTTLPERYKEIAAKILDEENVAEHLLIRFNSHLLFASFPEYLYDPSTWGNGVSTRMVDRFAENGIERFVLTSDGIETLEIRPHVAAYAREKGYLIGPYDSYYEVQDPDAPEWPTGVFDRALFETGGIIRADGTPVEGFQGVGYYVSPLAIQPYFKKRIADNFQKAPHSYYFLDCDTFGEFFDDYRPGRIVSASEDAAARVERVRSIFEEYQVPVGSEGGSYLFAGSLVVAEGVFFPTIEEDPDMKFNEMSKYFIGRPFPREKPERFFVPATLKEKYMHLYSDPRFRLPLYEAVFHDSIKTTSHYGSPSLKFTNIAETGALTEILYQVAPMYHFNLSAFDTILPKIQQHIDVFGKTHSYSYQYTLEDFEYLTEDRLVQKTRFGALELIANFRERDCDINGSSIPARSVLVSFTDSGESFVYHNSVFSEDIEYTQDIPALLEALSDGEWKIREQAAVAMSRIGVKAKAAIPLLIENLTDEVWQVRAAAAKALANMEGKAVPAIPPLITALQDEEWQVRRAAAYALADSGKQAKDAVPALLEALNDEEWHVRRPAALALGCIGVGTYEVMSALKTALNDPERQVRMAVEEAIEDIDED